MTSVSLSRAMSAVCAHSPTLETQQEKTYQMCSEIDNNKKYYDNYIASDNSVQIDPTVKQCSVQGTAETVLLHLHETNPNLGCKGSHTAMASNEIELDKTPK